MTGNWIHGKYCSLLNIVPGRPPGQPQATRKRWPYSIRPVASGLLSRIVYSRGTPCGYPGGGGYPGGWWVPWGVVGAVSLQYVYPDAAPVRAFYRFCDEIDAAQAIPDGRVAAEGLLAGGHAAHIGDGHAVDVGEGLVEAFGVAGRQARGLLCLFAHVGHAGAQNLARLIRQFVDQRIWLHLVPLQTSLAAVNTNAQTVFLACRYL